jgi:hypothetical protein
MTPRYACCSPSANAICLDNFPGCTSCGELPSPPPLPSEQLSGACSCTASCSARLCESLQPLLVPSLSALPAPLPPTLPCPAALNVPNAKWLCSTCEAPSTLNPNGYTLRNGDASTDPYCDGVCMDYRLSGTVGEVGAWPGWIGPALFLKGASPRGRLGRMGARRCCQHLQRQA